MKKKSHNPPKWIDIYPQGTKEGDEEQAVFVSLNRHKKWTYRSVAHMSKESSVPPERVEAIMYKYWKKGMVFQNLEDTTCWGYWERNLERLPPDPESITELDHYDRICKIRGMPSPGNIVQGKDS